MFDNTTSFEDYKPTCKRAEEIVKDLKVWVEKFNEGGTANLILLGSVGTGKTHLCYSLFNSCETKRQKRLRKVHKGDDDPTLLAVIEKAGKKIATFSDISRTIKDKYGNVDQERMDWHQRLELLVIDDIAAGGWNDKDSALLEEIMLGRNLNGGVTVFSTNLTKEGLKRTIGERVASRMRHRGHKIFIFDWEDYRE